MIKSKKGITLIALIITILVMLILVGIIISVTAGNGGVIEQAQSATEKQKYKTALEKVQISIIYLENGKIDLNTTEQNIKMINLPEVDYDNTKIEERENGKVLVVVFKNGTTYEIVGIGEEKEIIEEDKDIIDKIDYFTINGNEVKGLSEEGSNKILELEETGKEIVLEIPQGITAILSNAFRNSPRFNTYSEACSKIKKVKIREGITTIGSQAFDGCSNIEEIILPETLTTIEGMAFTNTGIISITIPNNVKTIGGNSFMNCSNLKEVNVPNSVNSLGSGVFWNCSVLEKITIPSSIKEIPDNFCNSCSGLNEVEFLGSVESVGTSAFESCKNLSSLDIPDTVKTIKNKAFYNCSKLKIKIPASIETIGTDAFKYTMEAHIFKEANDIKNMGNYPWGLTTRKIFDKNGNKLN